jgi:hypothetical protein
MTDAQKLRLESMTGVGKAVRFKNKGGGGHRIMGIVEAEVHVMVNDYKHVIQKIRFADGISWDPSTHAYRTGYWTYDAGKKRIVWGQYTQFLTETEYKALLAQARQKGWEIF